jgi:hypothetical protein
MDEGGTMDEVNVVLGRVSSVEISAHLTKISELPGAQAPSPSPCSRLGRDRQKHLAMASNTLLRLLWLFRDFAGAEVSSAARLPFSASSRPTRLAAGAWIRSVGAGMPARLRWIISTTASSYRSLNSAGWKSARERCGRCARHNSATTD